VSYNYVESDQTHYATNLRRKGEEKILQWDCAAGQDTLIVRSPYDCPADIYMDEICRLLSEKDLEEAKKSFVDWGKDFRIRIVAASDKNKMNGCPMNGEACRYTVFGIQIEGVDCPGTVYHSRQQAMISPKCDVPMRVKIDVSIVSEKKGFLGIKKKNKGNPFFQIIFPNELADGYAEKTLFYSVAGFEIPVTGEMIREGTVYVRSVDSPIIVSKNKGLELL